MELKRAIQNCMLIMKTKFYKYDFVLYTLFFLLIMLFVLVFLDFNPSKNLLAGGDLDPILNIDKAWYQIKYIWVDSENLGFPYTFYYYLPYVSLLQIFYFIFPNIILAHNLFIVFLLWLIPSSVYLLIKEITQSRKVALLSVVFYITFPAVLERTHIFEYHTLFIFSAPFILTYLYLKFLPKANFKYLIFYAFISLFLMRVINYAIIVIPLSLLAAYTINNNLKKIGLRHIVFLFALIILLWSPYIIENIASRSYIQQSIVLQNFSKQEMSEFSQLNFMDMMRGISMAPWAWKHNFFNEISAGLFSMEGFSLIKENPFFIVWSFLHLTFIIFLFLIVFRGLNRENEEKRVVVLLIFLLSIFGLDYIFLYHNVFSSSQIVTILFRSLPKYTFPLAIFLYCLIFSILINNLEEKKNRILKYITYTIIIVLLIGAVNIKFHTGEPFHKKTDVSIPLDMFELSETINMDKSYGRVLVLPVTTHPYGYVSYTFGYTGPDMLHWTINNPLIDKQFTQIMPPQYIDIITALENNINFLDQIKPLKIKYIVTRNCIDSDIPAFKPNFPTGTYNDFLANLTQQKIVKKIKSTTCFDAYEVANNITPFDVEDSRTKVIGYKKNDPTSWDVKVNTTRPFMLVFAETYDPSWRAIVRDNKKTTSYKPISVYPAINGFWIDNVGEYNVEIRYRPQVWFEIGLMIAAFTSVGCIGYLFYDWRKQHG